MRDWLFVIDHVVAIDNIFHNGKSGDTYNIGGNNELQNIELVHMLCDLMDEKMGQPKGGSRKLISFVKDRPGHDHRYAIDCAKLTGELGWKPSVTVEEGMRKTIDWYWDNQDWMEHITSGDYRSYYEKQYNA